MKQLLLIALLFISNAHFTFAQSLVLEDIVSTPDVSSVRLAPNGKNIAYLTHINSEENKGVLIAVYNTDTAKSKQISYIENSKFVIKDILWASNNTILITAQFPAVRRNLPVTETRLLRIDVNTFKVSPVISKKVYGKMKYIPNIQTSIIDLLPDDEDHILMSLGGFLSQLGDTVYRLAITDKGKSRRKVSGRSNFISWIADTDHNARIAVHLHKGKYTVKEKKSSSGFRDLWTYDAFSEDTVTPLAFGADNNILYVRALYKGKDAIYKVNLTDELLTKELVFYYENYDVTGSLRRSKATNEIVGVGYNYWDEEYKELVTQINNVLPDTNNLLLDKSADGNKYIVLASNDIIPGIYLIGDKKAKTLKVLTHKYQKLLPELLASKKRVSYKARDGLKIEGFLTLPKSDKTKNLPTIIFPHGGPISYDSGGFDYWTQFFANKGYAVFQMNFRGSSGYGHDFRQQGIGAWGQAMQDDVEDGTRWLISEGIADKNNVCIAGASYGGYAALMGGVKTPDLYQCIISFAGVTDVEALVKLHRRFAHFDIAKKQIGSDYSELWEVSPLKHAEKITKPVLLIHGNKDRVVDVKQSKKMFKKLKGKGKSVEYVEVNKGNHYLSHNNHRLETFRAMDTFLDKHLPVQ